jgi:hypothetical protein
MSMTTDKPPAPDWGDQDGSYWHSKRTVAAGLVLVLLALAVVWTLTTGDDDKQTAKAAPAAYESACGLTGGTTAEPTTAPDVQWHNRDGEWFPVSAEHGPGQRSATAPWTCYAHTQTGAVLAAWGIPAGVAVASNFDAAVREQTMPGVGQLALLKQGPGTLAAAARPTPIGFKVHGSDEQGTTVTFYVRQRGAVARCASTVQWSGGATGDWALLLASDGAALSNCERLSEDALRAADFVAWGPNS